MTTPDLPTLLDELQQMTLTDVAELSADVQGGRWDTHYVPYAWVAAELSRILGRDIPVAVYRRDDYLGLLVEARDLLEATR